MGLTEDVLAKVEDRPVEDIRVGVKYTCVKAAGEIGVAATVEEGSCASPEDAGELVGKRVAHLAASSNPPEASIGAAAINARLDVGPATEGGNIFDRILKIAGEFRRIGVVGCFPFVPELPEEKTFPFERRQIPGFLPEEREDELIPECDLVVITGSAFCNHTLEHLLGISRGYTMVIGPSTPLAPVLFEYGADLLAGMTAFGKRTMEIIGQGGGTKDFGGYAVNVVMKRER